MLGKSPPESYGLKTILISPTSSSANKKNSRFDQASELLAAAIFIFEKTHFQSTASHYDHRAVSRFPARYISALPLLIIQFRAIASQMLETETENEKCSEFMTRFTS